MPMAKVRVSKLAKEFGMTSKELLEQLAEMKIPASTASSMLEDAKNLIRPIDEIPDQEDMQ